ncbi:hypothetical protein JCM17478_05010 [Thermopirellula anaerolimosa]
MGYYPGCPYVSGRVGQPQRDENRKPRCPGEERAESEAMITDKNGIASYSLQRHRRLERRLRQGKTSLRIMKICVPGSVRVGVRRDCLRLRTGPPNILGQAAAIIVIATV